MDTISSYYFGNISWLGLQSISLILWPSFVASILREEVGGTASSLEIYFARSLGFALLALALTSILLSGVIPLTSLSTSTSSSSSASSSSSNAISPYASAVLVVTLIHHASTATYCYSRYTWTGETGFLLGCLGSSAFALGALYCALFAGDTAMISKYHHYDQSTSGFPFANSQSYRAKKKAL